MCVHAAFFVVISAWHPTPIFRRVAPMPLPVHASSTLLRRLAMLSEKACSLLRDFMLVFDLDKFFKGSTEVTESDAGKVLEYMTSVFEQASLLAPTTYMSPKGLSTYLKSLRNTNQKFKKEHGATYELIKCAFDLCHIDTTDGLLPAIIKAKGKKPPSYYFPIGVKNRNEKSLKEQIEESQINHAEERKRSDAQIAELKQKVAELTSKVNQMIAKRDGAQNLGFKVIGGTSILPVLAECNKVLTNKLVELKSTLSEVTPKQGKEGKAHTYNSTLTAMLRRLVADSGIPEERLCQVVHYVYAALDILRNIKLRLCVASIAGPLLGAVGRLAGLVDTGLSVPLSGPLASRRRHWAGIRAPRMRRQLSAYSGCCQFGTPKRPRKK